MKLKDIFVKETLNGETIFVSIDNDTFNGLLRTNQTAAFIIQCLQTSISEEELVVTFANHYKVNFTQSQDYISKIVMQLQEMNLLEIS